MSVFEEGPLPDFISVVDGQLVINPDYDDLLNDAITDYKYELRFKVTEPSIERV